MYKLPENLESKYRFVILSALRAEQLQAGAVPRTSAQSRKATVIAQEEVSLGLVEPWDPSLEPPPEEGAPAPDEA